MNKETGNNTKILEKRVGGRVKPDAPKISVIIPAYNVAEYIAETLDSLFAQTFQDFEAIVVNDGSPDTDLLEKNLTDYFDRIIYVRQENGGASAARNAGILEARGSLVAFLDGDDVWLPEKLEVQIGFLEASDYEMIYCDALLFGSDLYDGKTFMQGAPSVGQVTPESLLAGSCCVLTSGTIVSKNALMKYGLFDPKAVRVEDFELWFRLSKNKVKIGYQEKVLVKYRVRTGSLTGDTIEKTERGIAAFDIVKEKNDLTEAESKAWQIQYTALKAELNLEKGKYNLASGNFIEARKNFADANGFTPKFKLKALMLLLAISPRIMLKLFKTLRSGEFKYIAPDNSQK